MAIAILFLGLMAFGAICLTRIREHRRGERRGGETAFFLPIKDYLWEWTLAFVLGLLGVIVIFEVGKLWG